MRGARLLGRLRHMVKRPDDAGTTDASLLARFAIARNGDAFAELVRRHGPMVRGVCHRVLRNHADVDDAFQATFLVLARKAGAIRDTQSVANWLFGVARRVAARVRDKERRRARHERLAGLEHATHAHLPEPSDLPSVLNAELERLPERLRAPIVVCLVQGRTQEDGARELGWTLSMLRRRLERGRDLLRARLSGRGFGAGLAALGEFVTDSIAADAIQATCHTAVAFVTGVPTAVPAASLAEGVLMMMSRSTFRIATGAVLFAGLVGGGVVWQLAWASQGQDPGAKANPATTRPVAKDEKKPAVAEPPAKALADGRIRPGDRLNIGVLNAFADRPIDGTYRVEPSGKVHLGPSYGRVTVGGLTVEEAEVAIKKELLKILVNPGVAVTFAESDDDTKLRNLENRVKQLESQVAELKQAVEERRK